MVPVEVPPPEVERLEGRTRWSRLRDGLAVPEHSFWGTRDLWSHPFYGGSRVRRFRPRLSHCSRPEWLTTNLPPSSNLPSVGVSPRGVPSVFVGGRRVVSGVQGNCDRHRGDGSPYSEARRPGFVRPPLPLHRQVLPGRATDSTLHLLLGQSPAATVLRKANNSNTGGWKGCRLNSRLRLLECDCTTASPFP